MESQSESQRTPLVEQDMESDAEEAAAEPMLEPTGPNLEARHGDGVPAPPSEPGHGDRVPAPPSEARHGDGVPAPPKCLVVECDAEVQPCLGPSTYADLVDHFGKHILADCARGPGALSSLAKIVQVYREGINLSTCYSGMETVSHALETLRKACVQRGFTDMGLGVFCESACDIWHIARLVMLSFPDDVAPRHIFQDVLHRYPADTLKRFLRVQQEAVQAIAAKRTLDGRQKRSCEARGGRG